MARHKIGFGIVGLGFMGRMHFGHLREHDGARIVAVYDRSEDLRRGEWGQSTGNLAGAAGGNVSMDGIRGYERIDDLLADPAVEAVIIAMPTPMHADLTLAALRAGKHVLCEKPMALRLPECDRMIDEVQTNAGRLLMIGQCIRFWPQYEKIVELVEAGVIGRVRFLSLKRLASLPDYSRTGWMLDHRQSGGALFDLHVHDIDFAHMLLGVPEKLDACGAVGPTGGIDHVMATYRYGENSKANAANIDRGAVRAAGCYAMVEGGWMFHSPWPFEMSVTVVGETGTLEWTMTRGAEILHYPARDPAAVADPAAAETSAPRRIACADGTGWSRELDYFVDCIAAGRPVSRCTPESSRISVGLALLEKRAVQTGRSIVVPKCISSREICRHEKPAR